MACLSASRVTTPANALRGKEIGSSDPLHLPSLALLLALFSSRMFRGTIVEEKTNFRPHAAGARGLRSSPNLTQDIAAVVANSS